MGIQAAADNPIESAEHDLLGRDAGAESFARQLLALDVSKGVVVGVLGAWGSGKTSFINLVRRHLTKQGIEVLEFNPWMYSGAQQLVDFFFSQISAKLKLRPELAEIGQELEEYGEAFAGWGWLPVVGSWIERGHALKKLVATALKRRKQDLQARRIRIETALEKLSRPIVVVLDDIDRLSTAEIRDLFRLVRLTASFPNVVYLVAFDRTRVESALAEQEIPGRDYLEKILQVAFDLPLVQESVLTSHVLSAINEAVGKSSEVGPFHQASWPDLFMGVVRPLVRNIRDLRRFVANATWTIRDIGAQVAVGDVLALEAIRIFLPDVFRQITASVDALTSTPRAGSANSRASEEAKDQVDRLVAMAGPRAGVAKELVSRLFPAAARHVGGSTFGESWKDSWLRDRRVAHEHVLRTYLERFPSEGLRIFSDAERAWSVAHDAVKFEQLLLSLEPTTTEDVIASLEAFESEFSPAQAAPATTGLLRILPKLPERERGFFEFDSEIVVGRVVLRLLQALKDPDAIEAAVREVMPRLESIASELFLVELVGFRNGIGHSLVARAAATALEVEWVSRLRGTSAGILEGEKKLLRVFLEARRIANAESERIEVPSTPGVTLAMLMSAMSTIQSQASGSRFIRRAKRLAWNELVECYENEARLADRVRELRESMSTETCEALELAEKYIEGWRPPEFGDE